MNNFQVKVFPLIKWFHEFCQKNNLTYYMLGGTVLGAIRHKGFIPWDDDADFGMPRADYQKFLELTQCYDDKIISVESFNNKNKDFPYPFVKVYNKTTSLVEDLRFPVKRGVYIDIFPLDSCTSKNALIVNRLFYKLNLYNLKICKQKKTRAPFKRIILSIYQLFNRNKPDFGKNCTKLEKMAKKINSRGGQYFANFYGAWGKREIIDKTIFGKPTLYSFENLCLYGPENFHVYLSLLYGEYNLLPPIEKRGNHHDFVFLKLDEGFKKP